MVLPQSTPTLCTILSIVTLKNVIADKAHSLNSLHPTLNKDGWCYLRAATLCDNSLCWIASHDCIKCVNFTQLPGLVWQLESKNPSEKFAIHKNKVTQNYLTNFIPQN